MADSIDDRLDRYVAGELPIAEQRELAQAALDDPALFETLTAAALIKQTVRAGDRAPVNAGAAGRGWSRSRLAILLGGALAAAAAVVLMVVSRSRPVVDSPPRTRAAATPAASASTVESTRPTVPPVFLTARLADAAGAPAGEFRSVERGSRLPKEAGAVVSIDGDDIEVDLGSLDGIGHGSLLELRRDGAAAATLQVTAVFRERSRGHVVSGVAPQAGDRAAASPVDHVNALLQHADARAAAGDLVPARRLAELAVAFADRTAAPADARRHALATLGALEHRAAELADAERHLRRAVDAFDAAPAADAAERVGILDELGAVLIDRHAYDAAESILRTARSLASGRAAVRIANNLAALAALRGDPAAESLYRSALDIAATSPGAEEDARVVRANLEALRSSR